jgi:hypothetical protein
VRWSVYIVAVLVAAAFDASFGAVLAVGDLRGHLLPAVVVFALLAAPRRVGVRLAMLAGLVADLLAPIVVAQAAAVDGGAETAELLVVPGPRVLGFAFGALAVVPLRGLLSRQNPLSSAAATLVFSMLAAVVFVAIHIVRGWILDGGTPWWPGTGSAEVLRRALGAAGDAILALPAMWVLARTRPWWGFTVMTRVSPGLARQGGMRGQ